MKMTKKLWEELGFKLIDDLWVWKGEGEATVVYDPLETHYLCDVVLNMTINSYEAGVLNCEERVKRNIFAW